MRPLEDIDVDTCLRLQGVVFDVDDTVTRDGRLEQEAYQALWALHEAGLALIAVTGRPLGFAEWLARTWPIALAVGENGAGWVRVDGHGVHTTYWDAADARRAQQVHLQRIIDTVTETLPWARLSDDHWARRCDLAFDIGERVQLDAAARNALRDVLQAQGARTVESSVHMHAVLGDHDKATGTARALADHLGARMPQDADRWVFVGDSGNDAAAFAFFPCSVGVANVVNHLARLPVPPGYVTPSDRGRGFAELADMLIRRRS